MRDYVRSRHREVLPLMAAIDGLQRLFGTDNSAVAYIRSFGLNLLDRLPIIKVSAKIYPAF
jgi:2-polyprenylphenol 6-hydroxylase